MLAVITRRAANFEIRFVYRERGRWVMGPAIVDTWDELVALVREVVG